MILHGRVLLGLLVAGVVTSGVLLGAVNHAAASSSCALSQTAASEPRWIGQRKALAELSDLATAVRGKDQSRARALTVSASRTIAALQSARDIQAMLEMTRTLFDDETGYATGLMVAKGVLENLNPITRQKTLFDSAFLRAHFKATEITYERSPNALEASWDRIRARIRNADICEARKFFLLLAHATFTGKWLGYPETGAEIADLEDRVGTLSGISARHLPIRWFALWAMTLAAVDNARFDLAARYLRQTEREAATLLADTTLDPRARKEVTILMATLAPYFRQERVRYFCPPLNAAESKPCPYQR
jgi:hypothetical protein